MSTRYQATNEMMPLLNCQSKESNQRNFAKEVTDFECLINLLPTKIQKMGRSGGLVVSMIGLDSDDWSSNSGEGNRFLCQNVVRKVQK